MNINNFKASSMQHVSKYRIYYEDTDAGGIVYYANYLKFFERGRTEYIRSLGISQEELREKKGITFVVKSCELNYKSSAKLDDIIRIETEISRKTKVSVKMVQKIYKEDDDCVLCEGSFLIVCVNEHKKPSRIPDGIL
ncbi:tol-pal system-associated acyl-CoA thioesterase [Pseudomonadota bacterium]